MGIDRAKTGQGPRLPGAVREQSNLSGHAVTGTQAASLLQSHRRQVEPNYARSRAFSALAD